MGSDWNVFEDQIHVAGGCSALLAYDLLSAKPHLSGGIAVFQEIVDLVAKFVGGGDFADGVGHFAFYLFNWLVLEGGPTLSKRPEVVLTLRLKGAKTL